ncbi:MAG: AmmeMemoRadiSam system protein B [Candidatus Margulisiibacteriota bacterium]
MGKINLRAPAVAGMFYPASSRPLKSQIEAFMEGAPARKAEAIACMLPHAGYMYSGNVAVKTLSRITVKNKVILIGPNHTGTGSSFSIVTKGAWETPLGKTEIDTVLASRLLKTSTLLKEDESAHEREHSLEVELPLLQYFNPAVSIVPIAVMSSEVQDLKNTGSLIGETIKEAGLAKEVLIVASSDMTHYEPDRQAREKDRQAIEAICRLDEDRLIERIMTLGITMCGWAPVVIMLTAAKKLGATSAALSLYQTSAETTGDEESVVGYAGITVQ